MAVIVNILTELAEEVRAQQAELSTPLREVPWYASESLAGHLERAHVRHKQGNPAFDLEGADSPEVLLREAITAWNVLREAQTSGKTRILEHLEAHASLIRRERESLADKHVQAWVQEEAEALRSSQNPFLRTVAMIVLMPTPVWRRWLRWSNTDFSGYESCLRRMTPQQFHSLENHFDLLSAGVDINALPCVTQGMRNKVWGIIGAKGDTLEKYVAAPAIAHDFLGMGLGFPLYPSESSDARQNASVSRQLLDNDPEKGFEVNHEELGFYWFAYRKLRSNILWNTERTVELGAFICPGFWFTMLAWTYLILGAPVFGIAAALSYGPFVWLFGLLAAVPLALGALAGIAHMLNKTSFDVNFWKRIGAIVGGAALSVVVTMVLMLIHEIRHVAGMWVAVIWGIMFVAHEADKPWEIPFFGKFFSFALPTAIGWDVVQAFLRNPEWLTTLLTLLGQAWESFLEALPTLVAMAAIAIVTVGPAVSAAKSTDRESKPLTARIKHARLVSRWLMSMSVLGYGLCTLLILSDNQRAHAGWFIGGLILATVAMMAWVSVKNPRREAMKEWWYHWNDERLSKAEPIGKAIAQALYHNKQLWPENCSRPDMSWSSLRFWMQIAGADRFLERAKNMQVVNQTESLLRTQMGRVIWWCGFLPDRPITSSFRDKIAAGWSPEAVLYVARQEGYLKEFHGKSLEINPSVAEANGWLAQTEYGDSQTERIATIVWERVEGILRTIFTPLFVLWSFLCRVVGDAYELWEAFNERCPSAPNRHRKAV